MFPDKECVFPDEEHRFAVGELNMHREGRQYTSRGWTLCIVKPDTMPNDAENHITYGSKLT